MKNNELDNIDKQIITMLQENARMSLKEIAEKVFLSSPAVSVRIENLVYNGYIQGFHAYVNPVKLGYHIRAFINLEVSPVDKEEFYPIILNEPYLAGMRNEYFKGDDVECRDCLCKIEVISLPKEDTNES